ncbi:uncharacterized protein LOC116348066 [Contarinia nasturtii]|uniref:uncharacterized protein LOC116348066 n=1 Tax=Contarinia nasturtii TaxID=265458 RepID=UPI0012D3CEDE|nr:uncharacterized protein LOC116348066 [Contarinia nasturtii]
MNTNRTIWKFVCVVVGCVGVVFNLILFYLWKYDIDALKTESHKFYVASAINLMAGIIWFCGIWKNKTALMATSLCWWSLQLSLWLFVILIYLIIIVCRKFDQRLKYDGYIRDIVDVYNVDDAMAVRGTAFHVSFYLIAVICYAKLKDAIQKHRLKVPRASVVYTAAPTEW